MPIYEFYCPDCHTLFNFFSPRVETHKAPACPRCGRPRLERQASLFTLPRGREEETEPTCDQAGAARLEQALERLTGETAALDQNDPRQAARLLQRLCATAGLAPGQAVKEALDRLASGEDPERIEAELGAALDGEEPFAGGSAAGPGGQRRPPAHDDTLYEL